MLAFGVTTLNVSMLLFLLPIRIFLLKMVLKTARVLTIISIAAILN